MRGGWYGDSVVFVYTSHSWFTRGAYFSSGLSDSGIFAINNYDGNIYSYNSTRAVLVAN